LAPNEHYGLDLNWAYTDVYSATNICYNNGATATLPGVASLNAAGAPNVCVASAPAVGTAPAYTAWFGRDFQDAPTQYASVALALTPNKDLSSHLGYHISDVGGSEFFNDARAVKGSMNSVYQAPFVNVAWKLRPGLTWKAEYNYYDYGEGGPSGAPYCSTSTSATAAVLPCSSFSQPTGVTEPTAGLTAPRTFHANNLTMGIHYEF
jgi:hypothetical protein